MTDAPGRPTPLSQQAAGQAGQFDGTSLVFLAGGSDTGVAPGKMSGTANAGNTGFTLPRGATGFFVPKDDPLSRTDLPAFRTALYVAARVVEGQVGEVEVQEYPRTFHTASVADRTGESVVLCHAHLPWVAFAQERRNWSREEFLPLLHGPPLSLKRASWF
ncbi:MULTISPECIES: hypothetical protein [unclassified Streptomyces]|uniref:hypothetical protein n=1 Tax=unclassified Streptomyces TaxID=2593676 RepID=UPI002034E8CC|nr:MULTISPECIES: hypothetical protein [unclassified Streptomyces]